MRRVAGVEPGGAGAAIAADAGAIAEVAGRAELEEGVVGGGEGEGEGGAGGVGGAGGHDGGIEDGDDGSGGEFPEAAEGGGEEEEGDVPLEVGEGHGHVFAPWGVGGGGRGGAGGGRLVRLFVVAWGRLGGDDAHDDDVAVDVMGVIATEEVGHAEDLLLPESAGQEGLWEDPPGEVEARVLVEPFSRFG